MSKSLFQVCWYWNYLTTANELWAKKCMRRGWSLMGLEDGLIPGAWKRHYVHRTQAIQLATPLKVCYFLVKQFCSYGWNTMIEIFIVDDLTVCFI